MTLPFEADDGKLVGSRHILQSQNVEEAPERVNRPVPVPSVYSDERGEIHNLLICGRRRINLLFSKAGVKRSGDIHADTQHDFVFSGTVQVSTLHSDGSTQTKSYGPYQYIAIPPYTPHIFHFTQDTVMAEWWDGAFHAWFYTPYRKLVQESFRSLVPGRFSHYIVAENDNVTSGSHTAAEFQQKLWWTGLLLGLSIGFLLGRRK